MNFLGGLACFRSSACKAMGMLAKQFGVSLLGSTRFVSLGPLGAFVLFDILRSFVTCT